MNKIERIFQTDQAEKINWNRIIKMLAKDGKRITLDLGKYPNVVYSLINKPYILIRLKSYVYFVDETIYKMFLEVNNYFELNQFKSFLLFAHNYLAPIGYIEPNTIAKLIANIMSIPYPQAINYLSSKITIYDYILALNFCSQLDSIVYLINEIISRYSFKKYVQLEKLNTRTENISILIKRINIFDKTKARLSLANYKYHLALSALKSIIQEGLY